MRTRLSASAGADGAVPLVSAGESSSSLLDLGRGLGLGLRQAVSGLNRRGACCVLLKLWRPMGCCNKRGLKVILTSRLGGEGLTRFGTMPAASGGLGFAEARTPPPSSGDLPLPPTLLRGCCFLSPLVPCVLPPW